MHDLLYTYGLADVAARYSAHDSILGPDGFRALLAELRACASVPGPTAELGVFRGHTSRAIIDARRASPHYCYDTFAGICGGSATADGHSDGEFACSLADVRRYVDSDRAVYKVGRFPGSFTEGALRFAFVYIDLATRAGTRDALARFADAMAPGGKMAVYIGAAARLPNGEWELRDEKLAGSGCAARDFRNNSERRRQFSAKIAPPFFIFQNIGQNIEPDSASLRLSCESPSLAGSLRRSLETTETETAAGPGPDGGLRLVWSSSPRASSPQTTFDAPSNSPRTKLSRSDNFERCFEIIATR